MTERRPVDAVQRGQHAIFQLPIGLRIARLAVLLVLPADASAGDNRRYGCARVALCKGSLAPLRGFLPLHGYAGGKANCSVRFGQIRPSRFHGGRVGMAVEAFESASQLPLSEKPRVRLARFG